MGYAVEDIIQVKVLTRLGNQAGLNILHWRCTAQVSGGLVTEAAAAASFEALIAPVIKPLLTVPALYQGIQLQTVHPVVTLGSLNATGAGAGTGGANPLPGQCCGSLTKQSLFAGRSNRGRVYVPFPAEEDNTVDHIPSVGYQAALANYGDAIETTRVVTVGTSTATFTPVIFRRGAPAASVTLVNIRTNVAWSTQRSRGSFGRPNF